MARNSTRHSMFAVWSLLTVIVLATVALGLAYVTWETGL